MSTFGEIVEPVCRSSWEDSDDEIIDTLLNWQLPFEVVDEVDTVFILEGKFISEYVKMHPEAHLQLKNTIPDTTLHLYELPPNKYVCTIKDYNLLQTGEIVELLKPLLRKCKDVIAIQTKPLIDYQTASPVYSSLVIRQLTTSIQPEKQRDLEFEKLEQPNILTGVAAGVTCLREHLDLPAIILVYYIEHSEEYQTDEIQQILAKLKIINSICKTKVNGILNSNLYI